MAAQELAFGPNGAGALPILRSAFVVCDHDARLAGLPHVGEIISKCLDWTGHWTLQSASEHALPYLVHRLALNASSTAYVDAECDRCHAFAACDGLLPEMVILDRLFPDLIISEAVSAAAESGHLDVLKWLYSRRAPVCWRPDIAQIAARSGVLSVVSFLLERFPPSSEGIYEILLVSISRGYEAITQEVWSRFVETGPRLAVTAEIISRAPVRTARRMLTAPHARLVPFSIDNASLRGDMPFVIWAQRHHSVATTRAMDSAATHGHLRLVQWLHRNRHEGCTTEAMDGAAAHGHFEIVLWLHENRTEGCTDQACFMAAIRGHLDVAQWLYETRCATFPLNTFDHVCANGHLEVAQWLSANRIGGGSTDAFDWAAAQSHLRVVKWLHNNRSEGCTVLAMDSAACHGHFDTVCWLSENRPEQCSTNAIDHAAGNGHLAIIRYLDALRLGGFTAAAMDNAARGGHLDVVQWLHVHENAEGCTTEAMDGAAAHGHRGVVEWLNCHRSEGGTSRGVDAAAVNGNRAILEFFRLIRDEQLSDVAFRECVIRGDLHTARWIAVHFNAVVDMQVVFDHADANGWTSAIVDTAFVGHAQ